MRTRSSLWGLAALGTVGAFGTSAFAATVNVTNVTELRAALSAAKAGDEIVLAAGTYAVAGGGLACNASGTPAQPIVVRSATPLAAKLELAITEGFTVTGAHWHFEDLDVRGTCASDSDCEHAFHVSGGGTDFVLRRSRVADFNAQLKVNASPGGAQIPHRGLVEGCELFDSRARRTENPVTKLNIDTGDGWIVRANYIHDFHRNSDTPTYGAFMKSGGKNGLFERNLVVCTKDDATPGVHIGLSFGGGGTGAQFCAPAFDAGVPCSVEHDGGTMRNNVIARCSDVAIYVNRGKDSKILHNTLIATAGVDFRFATTTGEARGNVATGVIRNREGATHTAASNLTGVGQGTFEAIYEGALIGDLRLKAGADISALLAKAPADARVADDYCLRTRTGMWDLGALQHGLGSCATVPPVLGASSGVFPGADGGAGGPGGSGPGPGGAGADGGPSGSSGGAGAGPGAAPSADDDGCGCRALGRTSTSPARAGVLALGVALVMARRLRRRWRAR